jgi:hypothetical protein
LFTYGGLLLTAIGVTGGLLLAPKALLGNVLANLVLIGPALVLSNLLVAYVRRTRSDNRAEMQLGMLGLLLSDCIKVANAYLATLGSEMRCPEPSVFTPDRRRVDLRGELASIANAALKVEQADKEHFVKAAEDRKFSLPLSGESRESLTLPNFAAVQTTVALLDREIPCPLALLSASAAEHFSRHCYIDFVFEGTGSPFRPLAEDPPRVAEPKIGFGEISVWMARAQRAKSSRVTFDLASYDEFVQECLHRAHTILEQVIECCPERLLPESNASEDALEPSGRIDHKSQ